MSKFLQKLRNGEEGVTAIEYGLLAALIAVAIIVGAALVGTSVNETFTNVSDHMP